MSELCTVYVNGILCQKWIRKLITRVHNFTTDGLYGLEPYRVASITQGDVSYNARVNFYNWEDARRFLMDLRYPAIYPGFITMGRADIEQPKLKVEVLGSVSTRKMLLGIARLNGIDLKDMMLVHEDRHFFKTRPTVFTFLLTPWGWEDLFK